MKSVNVQSGKVAIDLSRRGGGVLLHVTSLPGKYGIGDLGPSAHQWVDLLAGTGQRWWQILPLGYAGEGGSPYRCYSAFASNPALISPEGLIQDGLIDRSDAKRIELPAGKVDYAKVTRNKLGLLAVAHDRFRKQPNHPLAKQLQQFVTRQAAWLDDFALFMSLCEANPNQSWTQWPKAILRRHPDALQQAKTHLADQIDLHCFMQFIFARQLNALRSHARASGIALIGDLPIFVSPDSSDVWANPKLFQLDQNLQPRAVAGVPPDMFSATGQRWGNPVYNWKEMARDNFAWWKARLSASLAQADLVRIDHFRGLESYWRIPADCPTAEKGKWEKVPGREFFKALLAGQSNLPLVAEDLGVITPAVEKLRDEFGLPGMRVLQFGFSGSPKDPHTAHNFIPHCIAYTGTHDNDTTVGWFKSLPAETKKRVEAYAPGANSDPAWQIIRLLWASPANQVIVPAQDLLRLGRSARMNTPGQGVGNWQWRLTDLASCRKPLDRLAEFSRIYERNSAAKTES